TRAATQSTPRRTRSRPRSTSGSDKPSPDPLVQQCAGAPAEGAPARPGGPPPSSSPQPPPPAEGQARTGPAPNHPPDAAVTAPTVAPGHGMSLPGPTPLGEGDLRP